MRSAINSSAVLPGWLLIGDADLQHVPDRSMPGLDLVGRQTEDFEEAPVEDLQPVLRIVEAQALRHVFERGVEQQVGLAQRPFLQSSGG